MIALEKFGKFIVENLRDKAIEQNEMLLSGKLRSETIQDLQQRIARLPEEDKEIIRRVVRDLLDTAMHDLLFAFQDAHDRGLGIKILVDEKNIADISGMLHGEHLGEDGWIKRFSRFT